MIISRKKYEADLERAHEEGRMEAFREAYEIQRQETREKEMEQLHREAAELRRQMETKTAAKTIPAVESGKTCPADRLDI